MDECFRFLINVDQCLNMSSFDIFFYKLQNERKYRLNQVQMFGESDTSFQHAISDIRMYLNKYPYHFKEYQFIVAMRSAWHQQTPEWESTLLYRLMQISHELNRENIRMDVGSTVDRALNLIMLYEADPAQCMNGPGDYMSGQRLVDDYMMLFSRMGISSGSHLDLAVLKSAYDGYKVRDNSDPAAMYFVERFIAEQEKLSAFASEDMALEDDNFKAAFSSFLKTQFSNYQVMELMIPRDLQYSPRANTLALLRIVEFINKNVDHAHNLDIRQSLSARCRKNWEEIIADEQLEKKYSDMLFRYEQALKHVHQQLEVEATPSVHASNMLPRYPEDSKERISHPDSIFEKNADRKNEHKTDLTQVLDSFLSEKLTVDNAGRKWHNTFYELEKKLNDLEGNLQRYADSLSSQYSERIEKRKKEALRWKSQLFFAGENTKRDIDALAEKRDQCLQKLKEPHMTPSLRFQDQINLENELAQVNMEIGRYAGCLEAATAINFFAIFFTVLGLVVLHYTVLQPFVFTQITSLLTYLGCIGAMLMLLALSWILPYTYYRRKIKKRVRAFKEKMDTFISGYFDKAEHFNAYINTLNLLDHAIKYHSLYLTAFETSQRLTQGYLWHKTQIKDHLTKLGSFRGLIDCGVDSARRNSFDESKYTAGQLLSSNGKIKNVAQCSLYWPQEGGDTV